MRYINKIIVHSTATPAGRDYSAAGIRSWHTAPVEAGGRGWRDIAYHYVVRLDGTVEPGRPVSQPGAHCFRHNAHSIGVVYVGGTDAAGNACDTRTPAQKAAMLKLLTNLTRMYRCHIFGHRDLAATACPSFDAKTEYAGLYNQIVR